MSAPSDTAQDDQLLKAKHRAMWAQGDYPTLAAEIIPDSVANRAVADVPAAAASASKRYTRTALPVSRRDGRRRRAHARAA